MRRKFELGKYFKTSNRLQAAINAKERIEGMQDYLDKNFLYLMLDTNDFSSTYQLPYHIDNVENAPDKKLYSNGVAGVFVDGAIVYTLAQKIDALYSKVYTTENAEDYDSLVLVLEYEYHDYKEYGDLVTVDHIDYVYVDAMSMPEEMQHQAEDGGHVYEYRGPCYARILYPLNKIQDKEKIMDEEFKLLDRVSHISYYNVSYKGKLYSVECRIEGTGVGEISMWDGDPDSDDYGEEVFNGHLEQQILNQIDYNKGIYVL